MASRVEREMRDSEIIRLRMNGYSHKEIANQLGITKGIATTVLHKNGFHGAIRKNKPHKNPKALLSDYEIIRRIESIVTLPFTLEQIERKSDEWTAAIRYECGHIKRISAITIRCYKRIGKKISKCCECEKQNRIKAKQKPKIIGFDLSFAQIQLSLYNFQKCCVCGIEFEGNKNRLYCNDCRLQMKRQASNIKEKKRYKIYSQGDKITLSELYKRDKGICYLCGKICDYSDYVCNGETIICGNMYPSIDHVQPLSSGGLHTWENVRLAHRICNSIKSDAP